MILYEFTDREEFRRTCFALFESGNIIDIYSPVPDEELIERLPVKSPWIARAAIGGGAFGAMGGFLLQYLPNVYGYSHNIGGRPLNSWPAFLLVTFEMGVLFSAFSIVGTFILSNRLPRFDREVLGIDSYNQHRHEYYYILTQKEDAYVKAQQSFNIPDPS